MSSTGFGPSSTRFSMRDQSGRQGAVRYPSVWWDLAHMDLPTSIKSLFDKCRYHAVVNPLVASTVRKMSSYPITDIIIDEQPEEGFDRNKLRWEDFLLHVVKLQRAQVEFGLDYHVFGNCIVSIVYPFHKKLKCTGCNFTERIKRLRFRTDWDFRDFTYTLTCPKCGASGPCEVRDDFYRSYKDIKLLRWNPADIDIDFNPITQTAEYAYNIPVKVRTKVLQKNQKYLEELPVGFIQALKRRRPVLLAEGNVYHFKAPTPSLASNDDGWGYPFILPALKDSFYLQMMKKAQEAILAEQMVPLDIIYPASGDALANPYTSINLADWKRKIEGELMKWRGDPNYKPILPLPVGYQRIGGNGKALMLTQEIRAWSEHIIAGMGCPQEFVFGGLTWSGSSVSLRMLENQFLNYRDMQEQFLKYFLIPNVARFMGWREISVHMTAFRMADDVQAKQLLLQLNQLRKVSDKTLLAEFNRDSLEELKLMEQELRRTLDLSKMDALQKAEIQGEVNNITTRYQMKAQEKMNQAQMASQAATGGPPGMPGQGDPAAGGMPPMEGQPPATTNVVDLASAWAKKLGAMDPTQRATLLQRMSMETPQLHQVVQQAMTQGGGGPVDMTPMPEQRPPRRAGAV